MWTPVLGSRRCAVCRGNLPSQQSLSWHIYSIIIYLYRGVWKYSKCITVFQSMPGSYAFPLVDESIPGLLHLSEDLTGKKKTFCSEKTSLCLTIGKIRCLCHQDVRWLEWKIMYGKWNARSWQIYEDIEIIPGFLRQIWRIWCLGEIATRCSTANIRPWREALFIDDFMYLISPWRKMVLQAHNLRKCIIQTWITWRLTGRFAPGGNSKPPCHSQHVTSGLMAWCLFVHHSTGCQWRGYQRVLCSW